MEESEVFEGISFVAGAVFAVVGAILYKFPPKSINWFYGYRTPASMRSQQRWDFAQRFSAVRMVIAGILMIVISAVIQAVLTDSKLVFNIEIAMILIAVAIMLISTERAISKNFTN